MADMDRDSDTEDDYEDDDDVGDSCDDSDYDYTGEESNLEEAERCGFDWQDEEVETFSNGEGKARDFVKTSGLPQWSVVIQCPRFRLSLPC